MEYLTYDEFEDKLLELGLKVIMYVDDPNTLLVIDESYTFNPLVEISKKEQYKMCIYKNQLFDSQVGVDAKRLYELAWQLAGTPINKRVKEVPFVLPMDGTTYKTANSETLGAFACFDEDTNSWSVIFRHKESSLKPYMFVTQEQIDDAPEWVKAIKPIEVNE